MKIYETDSIWSYKPHQAPITEKYDNNWKGWYFRFDDDDDDDDDDDEL